ncbi:MFS transporter [Anaerocolumna sp.]|uniref:MFS transporter n=1 Tax=Anaerocolumna sp. TaxID=2041569 RepID=UPI0028A6A1E6|nr:MFS transporter [Anaerocolumna sp.]
MATLLLVIIYIAFISLGLPDSLLGPAWPIIHKDFQVSISYAGIVTMIISGGTILSSFFSGKLIKRFGTGKITAVSVFLTAAGLTGTYFSPDFPWICLCGIPLGIGAGAVDSALNNFVALHYKAKHMNWLHCFWGIGATAGPLIMSFFIRKNNNWRMGYGAIAVLQIILVACLMLSLPLWKKFQQEETEDTTDSIDIKLSQLISLPGAKPALISFLCYCAIEATAGLWGSSYLVTVKGISAEVAASWISLYYFGITMGRFLSGFLSLKINNKNLIRLGQVIILCGASLLALPFFDILQMFAFILIGLGCAPVFPAMLHETPNRFGKEISQGIMGIQMAVAYMGSTFMPPLFGFLSKLTGFQWFPAFLLFFVVVLLVSSEMVNKIQIASKKDAAKALRSE